MNWKMLTAAVLGLGLIWATGCDKKAEPTKADPKKEEEHAHGTGPHGGVVFDFGGGKYHGEFKPDHGKKNATVWILGADEKTFAPIKAEKLKLIVSNTNPKIEIDLTPTDKSADGAASAFVGTNDGFGVEMEYKGIVTFSLGGKQFSGDFEEKPEPKK